MSIIQGNAKQASTRGFYNFPLEQSLRFNDDDSAYLSYTATTGSRRKFTFSCWTKISVGATHALFSGGDYDPDGVFRFFVSSSGRLNVEDYNTPAGTYNIRWSMPSTGPLLRDPSAWYHIVLSVDTTPATPEINIYVNGEDWGAYWTKTNSPSQNADFHVNIDGKNQYIGYSSLSTLYGNGYLAEVNFIDGTALDADSFGELKNGVWIPKDPSGLTYGTNGFRLSFADDAEVEAFNTVLYRGNGGTQSITGMGFQPDLVWIKRRGSTVASNRLLDSVRGVQKNLYSNLTSAEQTQNSVMSFDSDGFTVGDSAGTNGSGDTFVAWGWKAGGSSNTYNVDGTGYATASAAGLDGGTITPTGASVNTTYGFSIIGYQGTMSDAHFEHGLGVAPDMVIIKNRNRSAGTNWIVQHSSVDISKKLTLNANTGADAVGNIFGSTPTAADANYVYLGNVNWVNNNVTNENDHIAYCWTQKSGLSAFGTYSGNGSSTGPIIYTTDDGTAGGANGFKPAFIIHKKISDSAGTAKSSDWWLQDNTRTVANGNENTLFANGDFTEWTDASGGGFAVDFLDNGFQLKDTSSVFNTSGDIYIYAAFADTREAAFWLDQSGNDNDWQPVNLDHNDTVADSPTDNFCTLNPLFTGNGAQLADGNLRVTLQNGTAGWTSCATTMALPETGKYYAEFTVVNYINGYMGLGFYLDGQTQLQGNTSSTGANDANWWSQYGHDTNWYNGGSATSGAETWSSGTLMLAHDADTGKVWWGRNGSWFNSGNPSTGANAPFTITRNGRNLYMIVEGYNGVIWEANFGQQPFKYDPPA